MLLKGESITMIRIALDGPSGAGKSTLAKTIAKRLDITYLDTGALYRTVGLAVKNHNIDPDDVKAVGELLKNISVTVELENGNQTVYLDGENVGDKIRTPEMSMYASKVSANPAVREFLLETQRGFARKNSVIMDGRDIGTVILPDADVKFFVTVNPEERAKRRLSELREKGINSTYEEVLSDMNARDNADSTRAVSPAVKAKDAIELDNSGNFEVTVEKALAIISERTK